MLKNIEMCNKLSSCIDKGIRRVLLVVKMISCPIYHDWSSQFLSSESVPGKLLPSLFYCNISLRTPTSAIKAPF